MEHDNLLFYGATGVGKTFLTHCIAKELLESAHSVIYFTSFDLFEVLSTATFGKKYAEDEVLQQHSAIFDCDLLIIDDLGTEMTNTSSLLSCSFVLMTSVEQEIHDHFHQSLSGISAGSVFRACLFADFPVISKCEN